MHIHVERGRIIKTTPDVVRCLWENWDIMDALLDHKWTITRERDGFFKARVPKTGFSASVQHLSSEGDEEKGIVKYLVSVQRFGAIYQTLAALTYARTVDDRTSVQGILDLELSGILGMAGKLLEKTVQRLADEIIEDGDTACTAISSSSDQISLLSPQQTQILRVYQDKWRVKKRLEPKGRGELLLLTKLLMRREREGFDVVYERSDLQAPIGPFRKRVNPQLFSHFVRNLQARMHQDLCRYDSYTSRALSRIPSRTVSEGQPPDLEEVGKGMFAAMFPRDIGIDLRSRSGHLLISTDDSTIPWELLHTGRDFLCRQYSMGRTIMKPDFPHRSLSPVRGIGKKRMLILGDPLDGVVGKSLPEAREEIEWLVRSIERSNVADLIDLDVLVGREVTPERLSTLLPRSYDVIHYSGHAGYSKDRKEAFLLLNDGRGKGIRMGANEIYNLVAGSPIIFMNACETGVEDEETVCPHLGEFSVTPSIEGLASAFASAGAKAYIGTLWPVFDDPAKAVAHGFYERVFSGETVGTALQLARIETSGPSKPLTWASYVLFGQPDSRLDLEELT